MKRFFTLTLALCLCLSLTACGGGGAAGKEEDSSPSGTQTAQTLPDADTVAHKYLDNGVFSETLETLEPEVAFRLFGLADAGVAEEDITDQAVYLSAGATAEEVAVLTLTDGDKAQAAKDALTDHIAAQQESYADYLPDEVPKLDAASVTVIGTTVILVVPADADKAAEVTKGLT